MRAPPPRRAGRRRSCLADNYITSINAENQVTIDQRATLQNIWTRSSSCLATAQRRSASMMITRRIARLISSTAGSLLNTTVRTAGEPWRISSIPATNQKAISVFNAGVGLMVYNGHSNHWNYAALEDRSGGLWASS